MTDQPRTHHHHHRKRHGSPGSVVEALSDYSSQRVMGAKEEEEADSLDRLISNYNAKEKTLEESMSKDSAEPGKTVDSNRIVSDSKPEEPASLGTSFQDYADSSGSGSGKGKDYSDYESSGSGSGDDYNDYS